MEKLPLGDSGSVPELSEGLLLWRFVYTRIFPMQHPQQNSRMVQAYVDSPFL